MKPDWKDAPDWAQWLCKNHGEWYWAEDFVTGWDGYPWYGKTEFICKYETGVSEFPEKRP